MTTTMMNPVGWKVAPDKSFNFVFNNHNITGHEMYLVEFRFPDALDNTWVLARRISPSLIELGNEGESRGRKVYFFQRLEQTQFNLSRCTGRIKPFVA